MLLPISRPVRKTPQTLRPTARKIECCRASPNGFGIAGNQPSALRGSEPALQRSDAQAPRKVTVRASINPPRLTRRSSGTLRQQAGLRPSTLRYVSRARFSAARSHSFPPRRSYFARSASVTRSRIIAVCASSGGRAGRPGGFFCARSFTNRPERCRGKASVPGACRTAQRCAGQSSH